MPNCLQVKSIIADTPEEMQSMVNGLLSSLGDRVQDIYFFAPLIEGFGAHVVYWSLRKPE